MQVKKGFKGLCITLLCLAMLASSFAVVSYAEEASEKTPGSYKAEILSQLGVLKSTKLSDTATKETAMEGLVQIAGSKIPEELYFRNVDLNEPLRYGQAIMLLMDVLGYSDYVEFLGYDGSKPSSYISTARRVKLIGSAGKPENAELTVGEWAELLYKALTDTELMMPESYGENVVYKIVKGSNMLDTYMDITRIEGVVKGVGNVEIGELGGGGSNYIKINGTWYSHEFTTDMYKYFGCTVEAYIDEDNSVRAIAMPDGMNNIITVSADDVVASGSTANFRYFSGDRMKLAQISKDADFVYNRELVRSYTAQDLSIEDCDYTLIDNDDDGSYEVVLAEKFTSFGVFDRQVENRTIVDLKGNIFDLNDFYDRGEKIYDVKGREYGLNLMHKYSVVSYLQTRSGKISYVAVVDTKLNSTLTGTREDMKYVFLDNAEYRTTKQCRDSSSNIRKVKIGDKVVGLLDVKGRIVDLIYTDGASGTAYVFAAMKDEFDTVKLKALDGDGKVKELIISGRVTLDGEKMTSGELFASEKIMSGGKAVRQLVKYKQSSAGEVTMVDTAISKISLANSGYDEFTKNYEGTMYCMTMGGVNVLGTKYILGSGTKVFSIVTDSNGNICEENLGVTTGNTFGNAQSYDVILYNVDEDYVPEYAVYEHRKNSGNWVDVRLGNVYMVDEVIQAIDKEGEVAYKLNAYGPTGTMSSWFFYDEDMVSAGDKKNFYWSYSWSPDKRVWKYKLKDLPRGSIISVATDGKGICAFTAHHIPLENNIVYEKGTPISGNYQGVDTNKFNAGCLMSYGLVTDRVDMAFVVNNHIPTAKEQESGGVFPMPQWSRTIPATSQTEVIVYDSERDVIYMDNANCIVPGDHVFMRRKILTYNGIYVYK